MHRGVFFFFASSPGEPVGPIDGVVNGADDGARVGVEGPNAGEAEGEVVVEVEEEEGIGGRGIDGGGRGRKAGDELELEVAGNEEEEEEVGWLEAESAFFSAGGASGVVEGEAGTCDL